MITLSVFLWTVITVNLCILILHFLIKNTRLILRCGLGFFLICCFLCAMRLFLPMEFSHFQHKMEYPRVISSLMRILISDGSISALASVMAALCFAIGCLLVLISSFKRHHIQKELFRSSLIDEYAADMLAVIDPDCKIPVRRSPLINTPIIAGCRNPIIYLPIAEYSETDIYGILIHEYTHWQNKHLWIKYIVHVFTLLLWWNPFVFLLERDFSHLLEMQCDNLSTKRLGKDGKLEYLQTIIHCLESANQFYTDNYSRCGLGFLAAESYSKTRQRFEYQLERISEIRTRHWQALGMYAILLSWVFSSYYYIAQPAYSPKYETVYSNTRNSFLVENADGSYVFHFNEEMIPVDQEDVDRGYYSIYTQIPYKEYGHKADYTHSVSYRNFLAKTTYN